MLKCTQSQIWQVNQMFDVILFSYCPHQAFELQLNQFTWPISEMNELVSSTVFSLKRTF